MIEFRLSEKENELAEKFLQEHRHPEVYKGARGEHINFVFTPTSIGDACTIKYTSCDADKKITDYDTW
jgi:hypothetical protein